MRKKDFKTRALAVALTATVALSATACGSKSTAETADTSAAQSESAASSAPEVSAAATPAPTAEPAPTSTPAPAESAAETKQDTTAEQTTNTDAQKSASSATGSNNSRPASASAGSSSGKATAPAPAQAAAPAATAVPKSVTYTYVVRKHPASCTDAGYDEHICQEWGGMNYNDNYVAATGHDWGEGVVTKQATYFTKGEKTYTCKTCGETRTEATPELDKTYHIKQVVAPTCTAEGYTIYECNEVPGLTYTGEYTAKLPHSWDSGVVTKAATIYEKGVKTFTCTVCGETRTEEIPLLEKTWHKGETVAPTCTEQGYTVYICDQDETLTEKRDYTAALGHDWNEGEVTTEPTCTTAGVKTFTCTRDGVTKTEEIPALGHSWGEGVVTKDATCEEDGVMTYHCTHDGCTEVKTEVIHALGHAWDEGKVTTDPTCTTAGVKTFTCSLDGATKTEEIPALGHAFAETGIVTKAATCEEDGVMTYPCTHDGCTEVKTEVIPALGHDWGEGVVTKAPTCEEDGEKLYTCTHDSSHTRTEVIAKLGHNWDSGKVTKEPTYEEDGEMTFTCQNDPSHTYTEVIPVKKYTFTVTVVAPTCTEQGYTLHTCNENPDKTYKDTYVDALGHDYKEVTTPATCKDKGSVDKVCTRCGEIEHIRDLPVTEEHQWDSGKVTKAATCTEAGEMLYTCTVCGKTKTEVTKALGHSWEEKTTQATCTKAGSVDRTCKTCGVTEHVKDLPATGNHSWDSGKVTKEATCTENGTTTYTCTVCGETKTEDNIPATGHQFFGGNCNKCGISEDYDAEHFKQTVFNQVNAYRQERGVGTLTYLNQYQNVADLRARELAQNYAHTRPNGEPFYTAYEDLGYGNYLDVGLCAENAGKMSGTSFYEDWAVRYWKTSPPHNNAMLSNGSKGTIIGSYYDPETQWYYVVQMFFASDGSENTTSTQSADFDEQNAVEIQSAATDTANETQPETAPVAESASSESTDAAPAADESSKSDVIAADAAESKAAAPIATEESSAPAQDTPKEEKSAADSIAVQNLGTDSLPAAENAVPVFIDNIYFVDAGFAVNTEEEEVALPVEEVEDVYTVTAEEAAPVLPEEADEAAPAEEADTPAEDIPDVTPADENQIL